MNRPLDTSDGIAAAELALYSLALLASIYLCTLHGFLKETGWRALLILSLARILGGAFRLATISDPGNVKLYAGWMTLEGIGLAPLTSLMLGLMTRVFTSMSREGGPPIFPPWCYRAIDLTFLVSIILLVVGGSTSKFSIVDGQVHIHYSTLSHVAVALLILLLAVVVAELFVAAAHRRRVPAGEHRIIYVVALCVPFVALRLAYSCLLVYGGHREGPWVYFAISSVPEMVVTVTCVVLGFTLPVLPKELRHSKPIKHQGRR